jgi:hypothetical protein
MIHLGLTETSQNISEKGAKPQERIQHIHQHSEREEASDISSYKIQFLNNRFKKQDLSQRVAPVTSPGSKRLKQSHI